MPGHPPARHPARPQAGLGLVSGVLALVAVGIVLAAAARALPVLMEYRAVSDAVRQAAQAENATAARTRFERLSQVEGIQSLTASDLQIDGAPGGLRVAFAYQREGPLAGPVFLTFKLHGSAP